MEEKQLVGAPLAGEVAERPVDPRLRVFLADQVVTSIVPGAVEQLPAGDVAARVADLVGAEMIEHVLQILGGGASVSFGVSDDQREVLVERHDAFVLGVGVADLGAERD